MAWLLLATVLLAVVAALCWPQAAVRLLGGGRYVLHELPPTGFSAEEPTPAASEAARVEETRPLPRLIAQADWSEPPPPDARLAVADARQRQTKPPALPKPPQIPVPPPGQAGLVMLLRSDVLRPAAPAELARWKRRHAASAGRPASRELDQQLGRMPAYTIQGEMHFPADLTGAHAMVFLLGEKVPYPQGSPGHSVVLDLSSGSCIGAPCHGLLGE